MRLLPPGSLPWLVAHDLRVAARQTGSRPWLLALVAAGFALLGVLLALALRRVPLEPTPAVAAGALVATLAMLSFAVTQGMSGAQRALFEAGDLDLLLTAPVPPRRVLAARMLGFALRVFTTQGLFLLPVALPVAIIAEPRLWGVPALLGAVALAGSALGVALTLLLARLSGPRAARTVAQVAAALMGAALFLGSQFVAHRGEGRGGAALFAEAMRRGWGEGAGALPARAAFADPVALGLLCGGALALFAAMALLLRRLFVGGYLAARARPAARAATAGLGARFGRGLFATVVAKEARLLRRDPALLFRLLLRLLYLLPLAFALWGGRGHGLFAPALTFVAVLAGGQLAGSVAQLTIHGEDAPDLLAVSPAPAKSLRRAKLAAALLLSAPVALALPLAIGWLSPPAAAAAVTGTALAGAAIGAIELRLGKPVSRAAFGQRRTGSTRAAIIGMLAALLIAGAAAGVAFAAG